MQSRPKWHRDLCGLPTQKSKPAGLAKGIDLVSEDESKAAVKDRVDTMLLQVQLPTPIGTTFLLPVAGTAISSHTPTLQYCPRQNNYATVGFSLVFPLT